ncbi:MAG: hypothetical protein D6692_11030 [Planctomycetota bacterium]|nr:MAG: hypothetical protein D6692_11030 [Planctomycetota bacterium]
MKRLMLTAAVLFAATAVGCSSTQTCKTSGACCGACKAGETCKDGCCNKGGECCGKCGGDKAECCGTCGGEGHGHEHAKMCPDCKDGKMCDACKAKQG